MKTTILIFVCIVTSVFAAIKTVATQLAGHWRYADQSESCDYFFRADGTFTGNVAQNGKVVWEFAGKWSSDGKTLNYEYTRSSVEHVPTGTKDMDKLVKITKDYYVIAARDGSQRKYKKVP